MVYEITIEEVGKYLAVFLTGTLGIWKSIPVGIALGLAPFYTATLTALGASFSSLIVFFSGEPFRQWLLKKIAGKSISKKREKFANWLEKYGVAGLGLIVTGLLGSLIALILGMILLNDRRRFIIFLLLGIVLWSFGITYLSDPIIEWFKQLI